jgi:uncharacterized protein YuzE
MSHFDREADIAALDLEGYEGRQTYGQDHGWGLVLRDRKSDDVVGFEFWKASERLPAELLDALPEPKSEGVVVERQSA